MNKVLVVSLVGIVSSFAIACSSKLCFEHPGSTQGQLSYAEAHCDKGDGGKNDGLTCQLDGGDGGVNSCACGKGLGFWKTHTDQWTVSSFTLGTTTYTKDQALALLQSPVKGDASVLLARDVVVALLNGNPSATSTLMIDSQSWLSSNGMTLPYGTSPSTSSGQTAMKLVVQFNCGDVDTDDADGGDDHSDSGKSDDHPDASDHGDR